MLEKSKKSKDQTRKIYSKYNIDGLNDDEMTSSAMETQEPSQRMIIGKLE